MEKKQLKVSSTIDYNGELLATGVDFTKALNEDRLDVPYVHEYLDALIQVTIRKLRKMQLVKPYDEEKEDASGRIW